MNQWPELGDLPLEPSTAEWHELVETLQKFLGKELNSLGREATVRALVKPREEFSGIADYLEYLFTPGFNPAHPGFMAYIPGGGLVTSALADWVIKTMNRYGTAHFAAPALADLEYQVISRFAEWVGYEEGFAGVLTTGGSLANFTALVTARRAMLPENFLQGVIYCSDQTHHSVMKAANLAGFSAGNLRVIPSNDRYRLDTAALVTQIEEDRSNGHSPFLIVASAGTTNTGSIDPIAELADISARLNLWFHVDAAYGGAFLLTERGRKWFVGIERADSVTLDPHKGLFLPYGTGGILVKDRERLIEAHELRGEYMPDLDHARAHLDPFSLSVELSREHRGLKVALPFMLHGESAFTDALDEKLDLARWLYQEMSQIDGIELLNEPELTTFAFRLAEGGDSDNRALLDEINAGGEVFISGTVLNQAFALRVSILSHRTHQKDVATFLRELKRAAGAS